VDSVTVGIVPDGWCVVATLVGGSTAGGTHGSLREAALEAYGKCGVEVTHFATGSPQQAAAERIAGV
jgi:hypothetical protein